MQIGIVGLPNVGKSTLFNALTKAGAPAENYPFCTIDPNVGVVTVPDERLDNLSKLYDTLSRVPAVVEFVDIAGLVKGAGKGEGLGNQFLGHIRTVNAILHIVRCFDDENVIHVSGRVDPVSDVEIIHYELIFSDLDLVEKRLKTVEKSAKNSREAAGEAALLARARDALLAEHFLAGEEGFSKEEIEKLSAIGLLTTKTMLFAANVAEDDIGEENDHVKALREYLSIRFPESPLLVISARIEAEIAELNEEEKAEFLSDLGLKASGLDTVIRRGYEALDYITFFTAGHKECRAWTITRGMKAPQAAGKIHTDFERGFIRAEVTKYDNLIAASSDVKARELGYTRSEGKEYVVLDGDVIFFRFNV